MEMTQVLNIKWRTNQQQPHPPQMALKLTIYFYVCYNNTILVHCIIILNFRSQFLYFHFFYLLHNPNSQPCVYDNEQISIMVWTFVKDLKQRTWHDFPSH